MKINDDVLEVLSRCKADGAQVFLPEQLDRKLYVAVNKVLEAIGGKWNRKAKAHLFELDAVTRLDDAIVSGEVDKPADFGFFETPEELAIKVVEAAGVKQGQRVLEPSAGRGRIAVVAHALGAEVYCVELQKSNCDALVRIGLGVFSKHILHRNFLDMKLDQSFDRICMNPPFAKGQDVMHVMHAYGCLKPGGRLVSIMSAGVSFRRENKYETFRRFIYENGGTLEPLPDDSFKESGTRVRTVLVTMEKR